ncbi:hypothetical protein INT45_012723 [Circinella minor]|uniref:Uncharacterized protein n=1 Tax=Circinella minor TaxID=1195481 RepID=A0A8H7VKE6_9FUNG|nr:hypothetical protein INT45_012723 [Circinella minor]
MRLRHDGIYIMQEMCRVAFPASLQDLAGFLSLKKIRTLLMVSDVDWRLCKPVNDEIHGSRCAFQLTQPFSFFTFLKNQHIKQHVQKLVDEEPQVTVIEVVDDLVTKFEDFSLSKNQVHHPMRTILCNLSVSIVRFESKKRNSLENLEEWYKWFMDWKGSNVDFTPKIMSL